MKRKGKAETVRVMGFKWQWDYAARQWKCSGNTGEWQLWYHETQWLLMSPGGVIYTLLRQHRYDAMVTAGFKIVEIERWLAGR
jgi:hypothetical protein